VKTFGEAYESEFGATAFTVIETPNEVEPPEFIAVTTYVSIEETTVGVPEITPEVVLKFNPEGKLGLIE
jgi:hypothetical protein